MRWLLLFLLIGCELTPDDVKEEPTVEAAVVTPQSALWDFSTASDYTYDSRYISITGGKAVLQQLGQSFSTSASFSNGTFNGTIFENDKLTIVNDTNCNGILYPCNEHSAAATPSFANIVAYFKFNETAANTAPGGTDFADSSGNDYHISDQSINITYGVQAKLYAGVQTGTDSYGTATISSGPLSTWDWNTDFTLSFWVKANPTQLDISSTVNEIFTLESDNGYLFRVSYRNQSHSQNGQILVSRSNDGVSSVATRSVNTVSGDTYHHIAFTKSGANLRMFYDGVVVDTDTDQAFTAQVPTRLVLNDIDITRSFIGNLDELTVWSLALTDDQVRSVYDRQRSSSNATCDSSLGNCSSLAADWTPQYSSLISYWNFDNNANDQIGANNLTASGDATYSSTAKVGTHSAKFDGNGDFYFVASDLGAPANLTLMAWGKLDAEDTLGSEAISIGNDVLIRFSNTSPGGFVTATFDDGGGFNPINSMIPVLSDGWVHVAYTFNDATDTQVLYLNGIQVGTTGVVGSISYDGGTTRIGAHSGPDRDMSGLIDEVAVWSVALSAAEVKFIYERQRHAFSGSYESEILDLGISGSWSALSWIADLPYGKELTGSTGNELATSYVDLVNSSGTLGDSNLSTSLVGHWTFNESAATAGVYNDFADSSGNGNNGEAVGALTFGDANAAFYQSINVGAAGQYADVGTLGNLGSNLNSGFTTCSWVSTRQTPTRGTIIGNYDGAAPDTPSFVFQVNRGVALDTDGYLWAFFRDGGGAAPGRKDITAFTTEVAEYNDGKWHHLCVSLDTPARLVTFYVDGKAYTASYSQRSTLLSFSDMDQEVFVGAYNDAGGGFLDTLVGNIDETAVWNRALNASEIVQLYQRGSSNVRYQVRSCDDAACSGETWLGPDGTEHTFYSEIHNCSTKDVSGNCTADVLTTSPNLQFSDYVTAVTNNRYFQYRLIMGTDDRNLLCASQNCKPEVSQIDLGPTNRFFGGAPSISNVTPASFASLPGLRETSAGGCSISYQISPDNVSFYYWNGTIWQLAAAPSQSNIISVTNANLQQFTTDVGAGSLYWRAYLNSNTVQSCELDQLDFTLP